MNGHRARGEGTLHWHEGRQRWIAATVVGYDGRDKQIMRSASGRTKTEAKNKLLQMLRDQDDGISVQPGSVTAEQAVRDWLQFGLPGRSEHTVAKCRDLSESYILLIWARDGCATCPRRKLTGG